MENLDFIDPLEGLDGPSTPKDPKDPRTSKLAKDLNKFNAVFEQAQEVCSSEVVDFLEAKQKNVKDLSGDSQKPIMLNGEVLLSRAEVIKLQMMVDDYKEVRETLLDNTRNGKMILESLTLDMLDEDSEDDNSNRASTIMAYSSLVGTINTSVKLLASSYKDISTVLLNLEKLEAQSAVRTQSKSLGINGDVTMNVQVYNTVDLIEQMKIKK